MALPELDPDEAIALVKRLRQEPLVILGFVASVAWALIVWFTTHQGALTLSSVGPVVTTLIGKWLVYSPATHADQLTQASFEAARAGSFAAYGQAANVTFSNGTVTSVKTPDAHHASAAKSAVAKTTAKSTKSRRRKR